MSRVITIRKGKVVEDQLTSKGAAAVRAAMSKISQAVSDLSNAYDQESKDGNNEAANQLKDATKQLSRVYIQVQSLQH